MAKTEKHVHKLKRITYRSGNTTFFCALDCNYKINPALALGKKSICWRCAEEFILNEYSLRLAKPHCEKCHKSKNSKLIGNVEIKGIDFGKESSFSGILPQRSLAERLQQTIQNAHSVNPEKQEEEEL
jgi:hypothetical protein